MAKHAALRMWRSFVVLLSLFVTHSAMNNKDDGTGTGTGTALDDNEVSTVVDSSRLVSQPGGSGTTLKTSKNTGDTLAASPMSVDAITTSTNNRPVSFPAGLEGRVTSTPRSTEDTLITTSSEKADNRVTTDSEDVKNTTTTKLDGRDNRVTTTQGIVDDTLTITSPNSVDTIITTDSEDVKTTTTTELGGRDNRVTTSQGIVDDTLTITSPDSVDNIMTTDSEDVKMTTTTELGGLDNSFTTSQGIVDDTLTITSPESVDNIMTTDADDILTPKFNGLGNSFTTTQSSADDAFTTPPETVDFATTKNSVDDGIESKSEHIPLLVSTMYIAVVPITLTPGKEPVAINCGTFIDGVDIIGVDSISLYRTRSNSLTLMTRIVSVFIMQNTSVIHWSDETLLSRKGVKATVDSRSNECFLRFVINEIDTLCEDAQEYRCIMSALTRTGPMTAISESTSIQLYPAIAPYYTDDIEIQDPGHVNSERQHEYPIGSNVEFTCTGSIGSDRLMHKWHVAFPEDPCSIPSAPMVNFMLSFEIDGCNYRGRSTNVLTIPNITQPLVVWCWVSYAETVEEECDQLTENNLMKSVTILPVSSVKISDPCGDSALRSYILKQERTTYRQDEALNLTCRYTGSQKQAWFFRRMPSEDWTLLYLHNGVVDWESFTLIIPKVSLIHRGWYACAAKDCWLNTVHMNENQTFFVDVLYESCRQNGILIDGESCLDVLSASSCAANNGTVASIHTEQKSQIVYGFAFHVLLIESYVNIGLILTANTVSWKNFVWTDGSPLTFREMIDDPSCFVCLEEYPAEIAIAYRMVGGRIVWVPAKEDAHVACEWKVERTPTGLSMPTGTPDYTGSKAMFQCRSGEYISAVHVCDGTSDCNDVSDELNCESGCDGATFQCDYGECIPASKSCDFMKDCADGSDELLCNYPPCDDEYWQCANKECIPVYDVCDGDVECVDGSDEADVLCIDNSILPSDYTFRCFEPSRILPLARKCDGVQDCSDKFESDEKLCSSFTTYYSCLSWATRNTDVISSEVTVDYGLPQYGAPEVQCLIANREMHTTWNFAPEQDIAMPYYVASVLSDALWFETSWIGWQFQPIFYKSQFQLKAMLSSSSSCVQYIRPCGYFIYIPGVVIEWTSVDGNIHRMDVADYEGCFGLCTSVETCSAHFTYEDLPFRQYFDGNEDFGWIPITNKRQLPIMSVRSSSVTVMGVSRLICSEDLNTNHEKSVPKYLKCKNEIDYDPSLQCLMNFDPTGEPIACRDLTHLENCEHFTCPEYYVKCPGSFCLHMRYICDGTGHCPLREDELDCDSPNCTNHYRCRGGRPCVPFTYMCDGVRHCPLGDDELLCDETCPTGCTCQGLTFACDNGKDEVHLRNITTKARWISTRANMKDLAYHFPLTFPLLTTLILKSCSLEELSLHGQSIFKNITALRHLDISSNQISNLLDGIFSDITGLRTLILSYNPLESISNGVFVGLKALKTLHISHSKMKDLTTESKVFSGLPSLEYLDLSSNFISTLPSRIFSNLNSLKSLILSDNPLMFIDVQAFSRLYSLSNLQLSKINSERVVSGVFSGLHALTVLNLSTSGIQNVGLRSFRDLKKLKMLDIQNNHFAVQEFMFDGLENLQYLYAGSYKMCCIKPKSVLDENCFAPKDLISSCSNLIGSDFLRVFLWIIGLSALVGNIFVIIYRVVVDNVNLKKSHSIFVINLSLSDFIMGIYMILIASVDTHFSGMYVVHDLNWRKGSLCVIAGCLSVISSEMSTFIILMITVDRFIAIAFPLSLRKITWRTAVLVSVWLWVVSLILAIIPHTLFPGYFKGEFYSRSGVCLALPLTEGHVPGQEYSVSIFIGLNGILFLIIFFLQICIHRHCQDSGSIATTQNRKREIAVARSLFLVVATDFFCWFPIGVIGAWSQFGGVVSADVYAWVMVFVLPINSAINPFLYTYIYIKRRQELSLQVAYKHTKSVPETCKGKLLKTTGYNTSNNLKDIHFSNLYKPRTDFISLVKYAKVGNKVSPTQAYQIARKIIAAMVFLHQRDVIHGNVSEKNVYIHNKAQVLKRASLLLDQSPIGGDHDSHTDIMQYGLLVKKLLRMLDRH